MRYDVVLHIIKRVRGRLLTPGTTEMAREGRNPGQKFPIILLIIELGDDVSSEILEFPNAYVLDILSGEIEKVLYLLLYTL